MRIIYFYLSDTVYYRTMTAVRKSLSLNICNSLIHVDLVSGCFTGKIGKKELNEENENL